MRLIPHGFFSKTNLLNFLIILFSLLFSNAHSQQPVGVFEGNAVIGNPKLKGQAVYEPGMQVYTIKGAGSNIWFNRDEFHFLYTRLSGDFILTADFAFIGDTANANAHRKIGWMVRESLDEGAASINAVNHYDGLVVLQWRPYRGMFMRDPEDEIFFAKKGGQTIQLSRINNVITMKIAHPGEPLQLVGSYVMDGMKNEVLAGLYVNSHDSNVLATAKVWNVRIDHPVANPYTSNPHFVNKEATEVFASRLEYVEVDNGHRHMVYESDRHFEAPNWMPDGKSLLFNQDGSLFTLPLEKGTPQRLNTGSVTGINNDHVIAFDKKLLGITNSGPNGAANVYTLPLSGGEPKLITTASPSYLHGWNPNGRDMLVVGLRGNSRVYNLYRVNTKDGAETALTLNKTGHVDGPEYSPDGKFIYFNSNASGTMQIWRMKADGSDAEQLTFDDRNNWFPHISPDGRQLVFLSYPPDINPDAHPSYKEVTLRVMSLERPTSPRVIAYLYGGQGTINVPSWSPDSKRVAFVSYSRPIANAQH